MTDIIKALLGAGARIPPEDLRKMKLHHFTNDAEKEELRSRLSNPMKLTEIARKGICERFGPNTYEWLCKHGWEEVPASLLPFMKYESDD
jgi:hypothetical protein